MADTEAVIIAKCTLCGERIKPGDTAYRPGGRLMCAGCVTEARFVFRGTEDGDAFDAHFYFDAVFKTGSDVTGSLSGACSASSEKQKCFTVYRKDGSVGQNKVTRTGG